MSIMKKATKQQLIDIAKKKKKELQQTIFDTSAEGQEFIESFQDHVRRAHL